MLRYICLVSVTAFVSSTCYDLIDLRAEVSDELAKMGIAPLFSDQPDSEFAAAVDVNSIESCLANVRRSDLFLIVLSQRYGPSLAKAGYDDISATHLEYREARSAGKKIYMYVRDRLEADYTVWKRNLEKGHPPRLAWVAEKDCRIFSLLEEHRRLSASNKGSNWFWIFRDSVELKKRLRKDLQAESGHAILAMLAQSGRLPYLIPELLNLKIDFDQRRIDGTLRILNAGTAPALAPSLALWNNADDWIANLNSLLPGCSFELPLNFPLRQSALKERNARLKYELIYAIPEGHSVADEGVINVLWERGRRDFTALIEYDGKVYYHDSGVRFRHHRETK